jgi:hypothetical protein
MFKKPVVKPKKQWQLDLDDAAEEAKAPATKGGVIVCADCEGAPSLKCVECDSCTLFFTAPNKVITSLSTDFCISCFKEGHVKTSAMKSHSYRMIPGERPKGLTRVGRNVNPDEVDVEVEEMQAARRKAAAEAAEAAQAAAASRRSANHSNERQHRFHDSPCIMVSNCNFKAGPKELKPFLHQFGVIKYEL